MVTEIEKTYLFNFTWWEKLKFYKECKRDKDFAAIYKKNLEKLVREGSDVILISGEYPFSVLDVKYILNRLSLDDPELTSISFSNYDHINGDIDAIKIANAIRTNTHCLYFKFINCHFTDKGAIAILNALEGKENISIDLSSNSLTEKTYAHAVHMMKKSTNKWKHLSFGEIIASDKTILAMNNDKRIHYQNTTSQQHIGKKQQELNTKNTKPVPTNNTCLISNFFKRQR